MVSIEEIHDQTDKLLGLSQNQIEELLGLPDEHELDERRRKFFFYYLEPGPNCENPKPNPVQLQIRFNAVGLSSEVFLANY